MKKFMIFLIIIISLNIFLNPGEWIYKNYLKEQIINTTKSIDMLKDKNLTEFNISALNSLYEKKSRIRKRTRRFRIKLLVLYISFIFI